MGLSSEGANDKKFEKMRASVSLRSALSWLGVTSKKLMSSEEDLSVLNGERASGDIFYGNGRPTVAFIHCLKHPAIG